MTSILLIGISFAHLTEAKV